MKKLCGLACAILLFASCSNDDGNDVSPNNKQIRFSSELSLLKSTYQGLQIADGQKVGVFIAEDSNKPSTTYEQNLAYAGDGEGNLSGATQYFPNNGKSVKISAYHPYNAGTEDAYSFFVETEQTTLASINASDLLYCPAFVQAPTEDKIVLKFKHMLSLVNVSLTAGNGDPDLTNAQVSIENAATAIEFDRKSGNLGEISSVQSIKLGEDNVGIVVPQKLNNGTKFVKIALSSGKELYYTLNKDLILESGKKYTLNLVVNLSDVANVATEVDDWKPGDIINGGANEDVADKLLPAEVSEKDSKDRTLHKTVFKYDAANRVEVMGLYWYNLMRPEFTEYTFKYDGTSDKILGWTGKTYQIYTENSVDTYKLYETENMDFTFEPGIVKLAYEYTKAETGEVNGNVSTEEIDEEGYPTSWAWDENRNLASTDRYTYVYDNKKSPFTNLNMEAWLRSYIFLHRYNVPYIVNYGTNNLLEFYDRGVLSNKYTLVYNDKGYMTNCSEEGRSLKIEIQYTGWK